MRPRSDRNRIRIWLFIAALGAFILTSGCFTHLSVDRSTPPLIDFRDYQPMAILPIADVPAHPGSGSNLQRAIQEALEKKKFVLVAPERVGQVLLDLNQTPQGLLGDPGLLARFSEASGAKLIVVGALLDYRVQKSYFSSGTSQVWEGAFYEYQSLPTYHQGTCQMKVRLRVFEAQKGAGVWLAEGRGGGPSGSREKILRSLVEDLMKAVPPLSGKK